MILKPHSRIILTFALMVSILILACGINLPSRDQVNSGIETAQAVGDRAAELATGAAPTLQAVRTQAVDFATGAAPTLEAGQEQLATAAVRAEETGANVQATLAAAGIDSDYLINKARSLTPDENGNVTLVITEVELNLLVQARGALATEEGAEVIPPGAEIDLGDGMINFSADLTSPVSGTILLSLAPVVEDGQISFEVTAAELNGQTVPAVLLSTITSAVNTALLGTINTALAAIPGEGGVKEVVVVEGELRVVAGR